MKNLWNRYFAWREKEKRRYPNQQWLESWENTKAKGKARFVLPIIIWAFLLPVLPFLYDYYFNNPDQAIINLIVATIGGLWWWSEQEKLYQAAMKAKLDVNNSEVRILKNEHSVSFGKIQGYLEAFQIVNNKCNWNFNFKFDVLDKLESVEQTLYAHLNETSRDIYPGTLKLYSLAEPKVKLQASLARWLFYFLPENETDYHVDTDWHLVDADEMFILSDERNRQEIVAKFVELILQATQPIAVHNVKFRPVNFYGLFWDDFAIEGQEQIFFLHLGVSD